MHKSWLEYPHLIEEVKLNENKHLTFRGIPKDIFWFKVGTNKKITWECKKCNHIWKAQGNKRSYQSKGCPVCANQAIHEDGRNSLKNTHSELAEECLDDASKIVAGTHKKINWKCKTCEHTWKAEGKSRRYDGRGCPACANQVIHNDGRNSLANTHPELAEEYIGDANLVVAGGRKKYKWKCKKCSHTWSARGADRVKGRGCAICASSGYDKSKLGYIYILHYNDEKDEWIKCGITNNFKQRYSILLRSARKNQIHIKPLTVYEFDDGVIPYLCEKKLKKKKNIKYNSNYDFLDGKTEFFKMEALEGIERDIEWHNPNMKTVK